MDWFRAEVQKLLDADDTKPEPKPEPETKTEIVYVEYIVQSGDNLYFIAKKFNTTIDAIVEANGIINPNLIYPGDALKIPVEREVTVKPEATEVEYVVKRDDTLSEIAAKYGTTYQELAKYNGIANPNIIHTGQIIKIPNGAVKPVIIKAHKVVAGDTLSAIALKYGSTVSAIVDANKATYPKITPNFILVGWVLQVPMT